MNLLATIRSLEQKVQQALDRLGGLAKGGTLSVTSLAALSALNDAPLADGALAVVTGWPGEPIWQLKRSSTRTPDGATFAATASGNGVWERLTTIATGGVPTAQQQPTWAVNQDGTQGGSDANDGILGPVQHYAEVVRRWGGTYEPRLAQATAITLIGNSPDLTDPIYFKPYIEGGFPVSLLGSLIQQQTGTFGALISKNRATKQLLNATFASNINLAAGMLVVNNTRNTRARLYNNTAGSSWNLSQPLPTPAANGNITPNQDNSWAAGDSYTVYSLPVVTLRRVVPQVASIGTTINPLLVKNIAASAGINNDICHLSGNGLTMAECQFLGNMYLDQQFAALDSALLNCDMVGFNQSIKADPTAAAAIFIVGGQVRSFGFCPAGCVSLQSDLILASSVTDWAPLTTGGALGSVYIETGIILKLLGAGLVNMVANANYGHQIWGGGGLDVGGTCRLKYPSGAAQAAACFLQTGAFTINGQTSCLLSTPGSALVAGKTVGVAGLDADLGTTPGAYVNPGGGSITNEAS